MPLWGRKKSVPENSVHLGTEALDDLAALMRLWYGIEVDHWIGSEASNYSVVLQVDDLPDTVRASELKQFFVEELQADIAKSTTGDSECKPKAGRLCVEYIENAGSCKCRDVVELKQTAASCSEHVPIQPWLAFTEDRAYGNCDVYLVVRFRSFGEEEIKNALKFKLYIVEPYHLALVGFENMQRKFDDFSFIEEGLLLFRKIETMIKEKHEEGDLKMYFSYLPDNRYLIPCVNEEEAMILDGINKTLGLESYYNKNFVKFQMEEMEIAGLLSYLRWGLPNNIFVRHEDGEVEDA